MRKKITSVVAALTVVGLLAGPANAAASAAPRAAVIPNHNVTAQCNLSPGIATNAFAVTYVVEGTADSWATNGSVGDRTGLTCHVLDRRSGQLYGSVGGVSDSPHVQVGPATIRVPLGSEPYACVASAWGLFSDGVMVSHSDC